MENGKGWGGPSGLSGKKENENSLNSFERNVTI
jgi:hypothetical protein